jgi:hypothetical protein
VVVWTATDGSGNESTCNHTITVADNQAPVVSGCPAGIPQGTDAGACTAAVTWTEPTANDLCDGALTYFSRSHAPGSTFPVGLTTVTYVFQDAAGNGATCTFDVTVSDTENPAITCPANISQGTDAGSCNAVVTYTAPVGTDNCPGAVTTQTGGLPSGSTFPIGTTTNTFQVTDAAGHTSSCSFTVTVTDNIAPTITCPADINVYEQPTGSGNADVTVPVPATGDNCGVASVTNDKTGTNDASGSYPLGTTTVVYTVTDIYSNVTTCSFDVTVEVCPVPGAITGPTNVCRTDSETYSIAAVPGATSYTWTVPAGSVITAGQGSTSITVTIGPNPGNICVTASNGICESAPSCVTITVSDVPPKPEYIED